MPPEICNISCGFALQEAVSQTKYCCSLKVKILVPQFFGLVTLLFGAQDQENSSIVFGLKS